MQTTPQDGPPRQHGIWRQGYRFGSIGCVGCATFVLLMIVVLFLALVVLGHQLGG